MDTGELLGKPNKLRGSDLRLPWSQRFFFFFSDERAAKRRARVAKRRERKTSGCLGLESHFHADARVRI